MTNGERKNNFILNAQKVHGNTIDFSKVKYSKFGFKMVSILPPQHTYVIGNKRSLEYVEGAYKIWDCGYVKYVYLVICVTIFT